MGERSKTKVAILYFEDIANKEILNEIKEQIKKISADAVFSGDIFMEKLIRVLFFFQGMNIQGDLIMRFKLLLEEGSFYL